ncbi:MAG: sigma-70 family RNA polymerase sigma factor [Flavisolibacter sp.]
MQNVVEHVEVESEYWIIAKILSGNVTSFEILVKRYNSLLYKIARSYGFRHHDAEDLMQDTHVAAYMALSKFEGRSSYKTWISRIMINNCLYKLKYGYHKNEISTEQVHEFNNPTMYLKATGNNTDKMLLSHEFTDILEKSLSDIPLTYRTVFVLREVEGFSVAETADILNITDINVKVRLNRAKVMLKNQIEQSYSRTELYPFNLIYCDAIVRRVFEIIGTF